MYAVLRFQRLLLLNDIQHAEGPRMDPSVHLGTRFAYYEHTATRLRRYLGIIKVSAVGHNQCVWSHLTYDAIGTGTWWS